IVLQTMRPQPKQSTLGKRVPKRVDAICISAYLEARNQDTAGCDTKSLTDAGHGISPKYGLRLPGLKSLFLLLESLSPRKVVGKCLAIAGATDQVITKGVGLRSPQSICTTSPPFRVASAFQVSSLILLVM